MNWIEVRAHFDKVPADWSPLINLFVQHGFENTLQEDMPPSLVACVVEVPGAAEEIDQLRQELIDSGAREVAVNPYEEQNWEEAWKKFFKPRRIGENFVVRPTWEPYDASSSDHVIVLDPGQAFGTGDHPTTRMCLALMEDLDLCGKTVLDVGCGSGILSIGAAMLGASSVVAVDIDPLAVEVTKENLQLNGVKAEAFVSDGMPDLTLSPLKERPDVVLSNIISAALIRLAPDVSSLIKPGGAWLVSGILTANWPDVRKAAETEDFQYVDMMEEDDWVAATFLR